MHLAPRLLDHGPAESRFAAHPGAGVLSTKDCIDQTCINDQQTYACAYGCYATNFGGASGGGGGVDIPSCIQNACKSANTDYTSAVSCFLTNLPGCSQSPTPAPCAMAACSSSEPPPPAAYLEGIACTMLSFDSCASST